MDFEIYGLRIFSNVMKFQSFSQTARSMGLTQPTVSQQIAKLEGILGRKLFERVGHEIVPTPLARELLNYAQQIMAITEDCQNFILDQKTTLKGLVRYAMPESCQWTPHFRRIMQQISELPEIEFKIGILPTEQVALGLINGEYDFGFVVGEKLHPELRFEKFADEPYVMVASEQRLFEPLKKKDYSSLRIIAFPGWELFFTTWCRAHGVLEPMKKNMKLPTVQIGTLAGAIHAAQEGAGVAVLPMQCVAQEMESKRLREYRIRDVQASNPIYVTKRVGDVLPKRSQTVLEMLKASKKELG